jgi:predicted Fe-Mo cluster-binding NifX family protein
MTIAIAAAGPHADTETDIHGARAPYYLLFDSNGALLEALENPYARAERGAAPKVAAMLADKKVELLAAGKFGSRLLSELDDRAIAHVLKQGRVSDVIRELIG